MSRSEITIDLGALRRNAAVLAEAAGGAELWGVVKADAYGHGAADCARAALEAGARVLCVATAQEGAALRRELRDPRVPRGTNQLMPAVAGECPGERMLARAAANNQNSHGKTN